MRKNALLILAFYLDFILFGTVIALLTRIIHAMAGGMQEVSASKLLVYITPVLAAALAWMIGRSPGRYLLAYPLAEAHTGAKTRLWPNLVLGTFMLLNGLNSIVDSASDDSLYLAFGILEHTLLGKAFLVVTGLIAALVGAMLLQFTRHARAAALVMLVVSTVSAMVSLKDLSPALERSQTANEKAMGRPHDPEKLTFMQNYVPMFVLADTLLTAGLLALCRRREEDRAD
jgi:hypothetical protein